MSQIEAPLKAMDMAIFELGEAFKGLLDNDVWTRPDSRLLSVGELAAHVVYGEVDTFFGDHFESPLFTSMARYYTSHAGHPFALPMTADEVLAEVVRVHEACKASISANPPSAESPNPFREGWTWGFALEYQAFHIAYHTGQMYSVRHLLGHETVDN